MTLYNIIHDIRDFSIKESLIYTIIRRLLRKEEDFRNNNNNKVRRFGRQGIHNTKRF